MIDNYEKEAKRNMKKVTFKVKVIFKDCSRITVKEATFKECLEVALKKTKKTPEDIARIIS